MVAEEMRRGETARLTRRWFRRASLDHHGFLPSVVSPPALKLLCCASVTGQALGPRPRQGRRGDSAPTGRGTVRRLLQPPFALSGRAEKHVRGCDFSVAASAAFTQAQPLRRAAWRRRPPMCGCRVAVAAAVSSARRAHAPDQVDTQVPPGDRAGTPAADATRSCWRAPAHPAAEEPVEMLIPPRALATGRSDEAASAEAESAPEAKEEAEVLARPRPLSTAEAGPRPRRRRGG